MFIVGCLLCSETTPSWHFEIGQRWRALLPCFCRVMFDERKAASTSHCVRCVRTPQTGNFYALEKYRSQDTVGPSDHWSDGPPVVNTYPTNRLPSLGLRATALLSVVMVMMLAVLSASPNLHAWLHSHDGTSQHGQSGGHDQKAPDQDDDGCAVVMFANGVIAASLAIVVIAGVLRFINLVVRVEADVRRQSPRYWLPPLCGPPLR